MTAAFKHLADMVKQDRPLLSMDIRQIWAEFVDPEADPSSEDLKEFLMEFDTAIYTSDRYQLLTSRFHHEVKQAKSFRVVAHRYLFNTSFPKLDRVREVYNCLYEDMATLGDQREALVDAIKDFRSELNKLKGLHDSLQQFVRDPKTCSELKALTERDRFFQMCTPQILFIKNNLSAYIEDLAGFLESVISKIFHLSRIDSHVKVFLNSQDLNTLGIQAGGVSSLWESGAPGAVRGKVFSEALPVPPESNPFGTREAVGVEVSL